MAEKEAATAKATSKKKVAKGDSYACEVCGLGVTVTVIGNVAIEEDSMLLCCGKPMKKKASRKLSSAKGKITIIKNGPYLVSGAIPLSKQTIGIDAGGYSYEWKEGEKYPTRGNYTLCRCGHSKTKPFCDGTHVKVHFNGKENTSLPPYLDQAKKILGPAIDLTDVEELCAAARFCDRAGSVWRLTRQSDDENAKRKAIEEAGNCPSGRLVIWDKEGRPIEPSFDPSIVVVEDPQERMNGPIWARGGIPIESDGGTIYEIRNRVALCRCGKSSNKPFCDGSHCK
jgi:CDGSH-type Zn-finger protein